MKKNLLALVLLIIFSIGVSAHSTILGKSSAYLATFFSPLLSDTTKTFSTADESTADEAGVWKEWKTVDNFAFGKDRGNIPMIADLNSLHPYFRDKVSQLIKNCKAKGIELAVVESYRTHVKQSEYFGMGRKYTRSSGGKSKHQYGLAIDVVPIIDSAAVWDKVALWKKIGAEGEKLGLRWGGRWRSPYDPAHFEWSGGMSTYQLATGALPLIPKSSLGHYPCIENDIAELKVYWEALESEQQSLMLLGSGKANQSTVASASSEKP